MRLVLAALTVLVMGCAIAGVGMGRSSAERTPAPSTARDRGRQAAHRRRRRRARPRSRTFEDQGCDRCHAIAAIGADGQLGPRLDAIDDDADDVVESIVEPRDHTADGFPEKLMPTDFARRMSDPEISRLAAFIVAASGGDEAAGEDRRGRRRGPLRARPRARSRRRLNRPRRPDTLSKRVAGIGARGEDD